MAIFLNRWGDATNLSAQLANINSTGRLSSAPVLDAGGGGPLFDELTYLINGAIPFNIYDFIL